MDAYTFTDTIPLSFERARNGALVTGLTVTVSVTNAKSGAVLLANTAMVETAGIYTYNWTHGLTSDTECQVTYTVGTLKYFELIFITNDLAGGRAGF